MRSKNLTDFNSALSAGIFFAFGLLLEMMSGLIGACESLAIDDVAAPQIWLS
jgi:hypothetical protein